MSTGKLITAVPAVTSLADTDNILVQTASGLRRIAKSDMALSTLPPGYVGQNLLTDSTTLASWVKKSGTTPVINKSLYDGMCGYSLTNNAAYSALTQNVYLEPGNYVFSAYVKAAVRGIVYLLGNAACKTPEPYATFTSKTTYAEASDEFVRIEFAFSVTTAGWVSPRIENLTQGSLSVAGLKLERGSVATPYVPNWRDYSWGG